MSCNPAIGGLGKGHLVREVDALDGIMGIAADGAGIQYRLLNRRKGPAVQGPRAQMDRQLYRTAVQNAVRGMAGIDVIEGEVADLLVGNGAARGVILADGSEIPADAVILTTGTFLNGVIHIGLERKAGGRMGSRASVALAQRLYDLDLPMGRLKTGTPPRLASDSIDWSRLEEQPGDDVPVMLSFLSREPVARQVSCAITHTNEGTHDIVRRHLHESAMYGGQIDGKGPRYCPSIEDKIARFADKTSHQIFLEPEGLNCGTVYPNGISTSLPEAVQLEYVHSIEGLEAARIVQPGYAIEYDYVDPRALDRGLQVRALPGLWLAGQINGTTGYEEAAAQGLYAAVNAVNAVRWDDPFHLSRTESYIGVMIDDLITRGVTEPYRMFTSRAEFRLSLRADNADQRLTPKGCRIGLVGQHRAEAFDEKCRRLEAIRSVLHGARIGAAKAHEAGLPVSESGPARSAMDLLAVANVGIDDLDALVPELCGFDDETRAQVGREAIYANYLDRQETEAAHLRRDEATVIPADLDYAMLRGLSHELSEKLTATRPDTIAAAARIEGMTPAALNVILLAIRAGRRPARSA